MKLTNPFFKLLSCLLLVTGIINSAKGQNQSDVSNPLYAGIRLVIASRVACRMQPDRSADLVIRYQVGDAVVAIDASSIDGQTWYLIRTDKSDDHDKTVPNGRGFVSCWIYGPLTTEVNRRASGSDNGVYAQIAAEGVLQRQKDASFEDFVAAENLLSEAIEEKELINTQPSSGLLKFRRLSIVESAIARKFSSTELYENPLEHSWLLSRSDLIYYFDPDDLWYIRPEPYWALYDQYPQESWAEELAWTAAQLEIPSDECYADCMLDKVERTYLQYWKRRPSGSAIQEALKQATSAVQYAVTEACPKEANGDSDYSVPRTVLDEFRKSLLAVKAPEKQQLLSSIDQIERQCYPKGP